MCCATTDDNATAVVGNQSNSPYCIALFHLLLAFDTFTQMMCNDTNIHLVECRWSVVIHNVEVEINTGPSCWHKLQHQQWDCHAFLQQTWWREINSIWSTCDLQLDCIICYFECSGSFTNTIYSSYWLEVLNWLSLCQSVTGAASGIFLWHHLVVTFQYR